MQSRLSRAVQKHRHFDQILVGKSVRPVVGDSGSDLRIRGGEFGWNGMQLDQQEAEPTDIGGPAAQMPDQVFFQLIRENLVSQVGEGAGGAALSGSANISR